MPLDTVIFSWEQNQPDSTLQLPLVWVRKLTLRERVTPPQGHHACILLRTDLTRRADSWIPSQQLAVIR